MKNQAYAPTVEMGKVVSIIVLFSTSIVIIFLGASFSVFSVVYDISFTVLSSQIHGAIFGLVVLGVRYFLSVKKLKAEVYKTTSKFSWSNFKKEKSRKAMAKSR